jgi:O-antigen/teichoic acid export membrane protein
MALIPAFIRRRIEHRPKLLKIVDNIGWLFFDKILRMGVGLLIGVWIARYLGPEQFGLLNFTAALIGLFGALAAMGLQGIVVRDIVQNPACREDTLGSAAVLQLLGGAAAYTLLLATVFYLRPQDVLSQLVAAILGAVVLLKAFEVVGYWFESQVQSKYTVWVQNAAFLIFAGIKAVLILTGASLISFAWAILAEAFVVALAMTLALHRFGPPLTSLRISYRRCCTLLKAGWPLMLSSIAVMIYMKIDQIMIGQMLGNDAVGIYSAAVRISEIWYFIATAVAASVLPSILEAKKNNEAQYRQRLQALFDLMTWIAIIVALPVTFFATPLVTMLFGADYSEAGGVLAIHVWATVFVYLGVAGGNWFLAENQQLISLQRTALGAAVNVLLNIVLIPMLGVVGAAWATLISYAVAAMLSDAMQHATRDMFMMKLKSFSLLSSIDRLTRSKGWI